jgi:hypothetical protein
MNDPIPVVHCACGWPRPLILITRADGGRPQEDYAVRYDCPRCGRVHRCGEVPLETALASARARAAARNPDPPKGSN